MKPNTSSFHNLYFQFSGFKVALSILFFLLKIGLVSAQLNKAVIHAEPETVNQLRKNIDSLHALTRGIARSYPDSVIQISERLKTLSLKIDYKKGIAKSDEAEARALVFKGLYERGFEIAKKNLAYSSEIKADTIYLDCINVLGLGHFLKGEYHKVYEYNQLGLEYAKKAKNQDRIYVFSLNAATILSNIEERDKALHYFNECLEMLKQNPDSVRLAQVLNNLGNVHFRNEENIKAKNALTRSIAISTRKKMTSWESDSHIILGKIALKENDLEEAQKQFYFSKKLLKNSKDFKQLIETNLGFAQLDFLENSIESSKTNALSVLKNAKSANYYVGINAATKLLHDINAKQNNYKEAYEYLMMHSKLNDSLEIVKSKNRIRTMIVEKNIINEKELVELKMNQRITKQRAYIGFFICLLLLSTGIIIYIRKISSSRKILIEQLNKKTLEQEKSKLELEELHKTKDKLFSIIAHDLRAPIKSFQGLLQLLLSGEIKPKMFSSFLPKVTKDVDYLSFTLDNLLSWAITQMKGASTKPTNLSLKEIVELNFNLFKSKAIEKSITLINKIEEDVVVWSDNEQTNIILRNLISNALKFTDTDGTILVKSNEINDFQVISVVDTGVAMKKEIANQLFLPITHISTYGTQEEKGTGMGLSICKEMVENNKGKIWVESEPGIGTKFHFSLPKFKNNYEKAS